MICACRMKTICPNNHDERLLFINPIGIPLPEEIL